MQSFAERRKYALISVMTALALSIWILEEFIPRPAPWFKPGFSYIVILASFELLGSTSAIAIAYLRVVVGSMLLGKLFSPAFILSLSGTTAAILIMTVMLSWGRRLFSFVGVSVAGAFCHIAAQIVVAGAIFYRPDAVVWMLPPLTIWAFIAGSVVGVVSAKVTERLTNSTLIKA